MELPPPLRPWAPWLSALVPELLATFGDTVRQLDRLVGPLPPRPDPGAVEPTGLDGLTRRGPYERLLLSEWAIALEIPEEFLRRATAGEHLFHELSRVVPKRGRRCAVLLDAGAEQLGGPRLAHLGLLVVFARRAEAAGASFQWGTLQDETHTLRDGGPAQLRAYLPSRVLRSPTTADGDGWRAALAADGPVDEAWVIGGDTARAVTPGAEHVGVEEVLDDGADRLRVTVRRAGRPATVRELPLPSPEHRTRWIRDPFRPVPAPSSMALPFPARRGREHGPLLPLLRFTSDGNRILAVDESGAVLAFRVPTDGVLRRPKVMRPDPGGVPIGLGWIKGGHHTLLRFPERVVLVGGPHHREDWSGEVPGLDAPGTIVSWKCAGVMHGWFFDGRATLHQWTSHLGARTIHSATCLAIGRRDGQPLLVERSEDRVRAVRYGQDGREVHAEWRPAAERAVIGSAYGYGVGYVVLETARTWVSMSDDEPRHRPLGATLVGAPGRHDRRGVLYLQDGDLWFRWSWPTEDAPTRVAANVAAAAASTAHYSTRVAWLEAPRRVVLLDVGTAQPLAAWGDP